MQWKVHCKIVIYTIVIVNQKLHRTHSWRRIDSRDPLITGDEIMVAVFVFQWRWNFMEAEIQLIQSLDC